MVKLTPLKQSIVNDLLGIAGREKLCMNNSNYQRRYFLMVEHALLQGETAYAELLLRNFLGRFELANMLTWINQKPERRGNIWERK